MSTLTDALDMVVTVLREAGISADTDARSLTLPGAWVTVADVTEPRLCGDYTVRAAVCLMAPDAGSPTYLHHLGEMLDRALAVLTLDEPAKPMTVTPPGGPAVPALVITTTAE